MKKLLSMALMLLVSVFITNITMAQTAKKETLKVWGNCGMCKKKIEKAAKSAGATAASWDSETQLLKISFDESKTSNAKIQESIAKVGYDTQDFTADNEVYDNLPGCCQYDRKETAKAKP